jgi:O-methyltransferase
MLSRTVLGCRRAAYRVVVVAGLPRPLRRIARAFLRPFNVPIIEYFRNRPRVTRTWIAVNRKRMTYSQPAHLSCLVGFVKDFERTGECGEIIETGCALGGSAILMSAVKSRSRPMRVFDVFGMIPPPSDQDGTDMTQRYETIVAGESTGLGDDLYYAYEPDLKRKVRDNFAELGHPIERNNVTLIAGKVEDTLEVNGPVCLAHIDVDWYQPVTACLERVVPNLTPNGVVVLRAYTDWSGCRKATDDYFDKIGRDGFEQRFVAGQLVMKKRLDRPQV